MKAKTVGYPLDNLPKPTAERLAELERLEAMPGEQIDTSDIPEPTEVQLAEMRRREFFAPSRNRLRRGWMLMSWLG